MKKILFTILLFSSTLALAWAPRGSVNLSVPPHCRDEILTQKVLKYLGNNTSGERWDVSEWGAVEKIVQRYMDQCGESLHEGSKYGIIDFLEFKLIDYNYLKNADIQKVSFRIPGEDYVTRGILALKKTPEPRPLVIFKCGLTCDFDDPSMLLSLMLFFDMGPFHVLLIPSNSAKSFIEENKIFAVGGLAEGAQVSKIAQQIMSGDWKYSSRVSRIHLYGISLGGHAALYSSLYADYTEGDTPLFSSVVTGCPVIDFRTSIDHVTEDNLFGKLVRKLLLGDITHILSHIPWFGRYFDHDPRFNPRQSELREMLVGGAFDYYKNRTRESEWANAPLESLRFDDENDFWKWMDYSANTLPMMRTPVYVWAPQNDEVVLYKSNSQKLFQADSKLEERRIFKLNTPKGGHCAFSSVYGWATSAAVLNAFFIARSPELLRQAKTQVIGLNDKKVLRKLRASDKRVRETLVWEAKANKDEIALHSEFKIKPCISTPRNRKSCKLHSKVKFRYQDLQIHPRNMPRNKVEEEAFTRTLNARLRLVEANGQPIGTTGIPAGIRVTRYGRLDDLN